MGAGFGTELKFHFSSWGGVTKHNRNNDAFSLITTNTFTISILTLNIKQIIFRFANKKLKVLEWEMEDKY